MINAVSARLIASLPSGERARIHSVYAFGGKLLVGLSSGVLQIYDISEPFSPNLKARLNSSYKDLCTQPIDQLGIVKDAGYLVVLSDSIVSVYDVETYRKLDENLAKSKGASGFLVAQGIRQQESGLHATVSRLVIACKRRLVCYEWQDSEYVGTKEILMPETIKSLCLADDVDRVVCGLSSEFCVVDLVSSSVTTVAPETHLTAATSSFGMSYIGIGSRLPPPLCVRLAQSPSSETPTKSLLVRDVQWQCISSDGKLLDYPAVSWQVAPKILGFSYPYLICVLPNVVEIRNPQTTTVLQTIPIADVRVINDGKLLYVATQTDIYRLLSEDLATQVKHLADDGQLDEAISLLSQIESVLITNKEDMLRELQILRAKEMFSQKLFEDAFLMFSDISAPPDVVISLFPEDFRLGDPHATDTKSDIASLDQTSKTSTFSESDIKVAVRALLPYLADTRRKISKLAVSKEKVKYHGTELSEAIYGDLEQAAILVDTTLFKCYMMTSQSLAGSLVRVQNHCDPVVVKEMLSNVGKWRELIDFYFGKRLHRDALELLKELSSQESSSLEGPEPTVQYLQRLNNSHLDLIFEFSRGPVSENPKFAADLFLDDSPDSLSLSRPKVFRFLQSFDSRALPIQYLEYLIGEPINDTSPSFHNNLAILYIKELQESGHEEDVLTKLQQFVASSSCYRPDRVLPEVPLKDPRFLEVRAILHGKRGENKEALELYAFGINDHIKARKYCSDLYESDKQKGQEALHTLLSLYLRPDDNDNHERAILDLLASQGSRMSAIDVISSLPQGTKLSDIDLFLQSQIRTLTGLSSNGRLNESLLKVHLIRVQEQLLELSQTSSVITNHRTCKLCMKRLGQSVISIFPNGTVVHYGCERAYHEQQERERQKTVPVAVHRK
jgi:hypothetical protein